MSHGLARLLACRRLVRGRLAARALALRGARIGARTAIGPRCRVDRPWCLTTGERVEIEHDVYLKIVADAARVELGDRVFVGRGVEFDVSERVSVGAHTVIAPRCFVTDHEHGTLAALRVDEQPCVAAPVTIGSDVWIGTGAVVLAGITIGDGAVVGANAVVTRDVPPMAIVAGVPARVLRVRH